MKMTFTCTNGVKSRFDWGRLLVFVLMGLISACDNNRPDRKATPVSPVDHEQTVRVYSGQIAYQKLPFFYIGTKDGLNLRALPSTASKKIIAIPFGSKVEILDIQDEGTELDNMFDYWCRVRYLNHTGWIFGGYLSLSDPTYHPNAEYQELVIGAWQKGFPFCTRHPIFNKDGSYSEILDGTDAPGRKGNYSVHNTTLSVTVEDFTGLEQTEFFHIDSINLEVMILTDSDGIKHHYCKTDSKLYDAIERNDVAEIQNLIQSGYPVNGYLYAHPGYYHERYPYILYAAKPTFFRKFDFGVLKILVENGADVNLVSYPGLDSPLHQLAYFIGDYQIEVIEYMLAHGANIQSRNREGKTPGDIAISRTNFYNKKVIQLLTE
jgi:hypothetical protein